MSEFFGSDGCDEPDYIECPEPEPYRFVFRDGSVVTLRPDEDPKSEGRKKSLAAEYLTWYFDFCPDDEQAKQYLQKNYR